MQVLREAMNDAPGPGEPETFPPDRIRGEEESLARSHQTAYTVVARHRASGEPAGLSFVCVHELRPAIAAQEDTSVVRGHRGHRLGLRMKLELYDWLRAARADVESRRHVERSGERADDRHQRRPRLPGRGRDGPVHQEPWGRMTAWPPTR